MVSVDVREGEEQRAGEEEHQRLEKGFCDGGVAQSRP